MNLFCTSAFGSNRQQRGAATIFITIVLLAAIGLITLYTNRDAIMEQRLSANEIRAKQAFAAANAGLESALAYMRAGGIDRNNDGTVDAITSESLTSASGRVTTYRAVYCSVSAGAPPACPATVAMPACTPAASLVDVLAVSCGWSDDNSSVQRVVQGMVATQSLAGTISTPLITRGTASLLTGGASVLNYFNDLTVWSGGSVLGQSNTGKTFIRDQIAQPVADRTDVFRLDDPAMQNGNSPACNNPPTNYFCSTQGSTLGHDTVSGDTNLASFTPSAFFEYIFGSPPATYRDSTATWVVDLSGSLTTKNSTNLNSIVNMRDNTIWVEPSAPGTAVTLPGDIGTQANPVVLIINGDLNLGGGSPTINGVVYVTGNITGSGNPSIYGALIGAGNANVTGNPKIIYDPIVLGGAAKIGKAAKVQGSWRDW